MRIDRLVPFGSLVLVALAFCLVDAKKSWGKKKPPPPAAVQGPTIGPLLPLGVQRGKALEMTVNGTQLANPTGVAPGFNAKISIPTDNKNGQDAAKLKIKMDVPADTPLGWYPFRLATVKGISNLRVFCVDDVPQFSANGANRSRATAQTLAVPGAVAGVIGAEQGDYYKISVKAGQRLSFDCQARRIGSAMDAQLSILDAKSMKELAFDNDSPGCHTDPRISYTFKDAGEYLVEVKDVVNRGGAEFFYRLRIGDFPLATTAIPMGAKRGTKAKIAFAGPAVAGVAPVDVDVPSDPAVSVLWVAPKGAAGIHGWPVPVVVSDHDEAVEQEPNNSAKEANRVAVPGAVSGRFQKSDDVDFYLFSAKKGQKITIEAQALDFYAPTLVYMIVRNAKTNAEVAKSTPQTPPNDQKIDFTPADDGDYLLDVQHLYFAGGPSESYRITLHPAGAQFDVNLVNDRLEVAPGGVAAIPLQIVRKGYTGSIELSVHGPAALSGTATIKAGQNAGVLLVAAKNDMPMGAYQFHVLAKAVINGKEAIHVASAKAKVMQALNGLAYPPMHLPSFVALAVTEKAPFQLAIKIDPPQGIPGGKALVTITATRDPGFDDDITLSPPTGLPATVPPPKAIPAIAKGKNETSFPLDLNVKTPMGEYFLLVSAKSKATGFAAVAPPLLLVVGLPFDLKVEPLKVTLKAGAKAKLKVTALRKGGYKGPITLDFRNLPANVTAGKAVIAADKNDIDIDLIADAKAAPALAANVSVGGTATALNNLQNVSPPFAVTVQKK